MTEPKQSPFALNSGRIMLLVLGAVLVLIGISTWMGGINAYGELREANTAAQQGKVEIIEGANRQTTSP